MSDQDFYVYALFRHDTGQPFYIGKGRRLARMRFHGMPSDGKNPHKRNILAKARREGGECPRIVLRDGLTEAEAFAAEVALIAAVGRGNSGPLVNATDGGEGVSGLRRTPESRAKMSLAMKGRVITPEWRARMSVSNKGKSRSDEARARMSAAQKTRIRGPVSDETRAKMSAAKKGMVVSAETRAKMSAAKKGHAVSIETRAKMSAAKKGRAHPSLLASLSGRKLSDETRERMREAATARWARQRLISGDSLSSGASQLELFR